jgi:hypothetical protein
VSGGCRDITVRQRRFAHARRRYSAGRTLDAPRQRRRVDRLIEPGNPSCEMGA